MFLHYNKIAYLNFAGASGDSASEHKLIPDNTNEHGVSAEGDPDPKDDTEQPDDEGGKSNLKIID